jgi:hypothetical protein
VYFVGLAVFVSFAFEKLSDFLGCEADATVVAEVEDIQADILFAIFEFRQFHNFIIATDFTDCTDFLDTDFRRGVLLRSTT